MENRINYVGWVTPNFNLGDEALYAISEQIFAKYNYNVCRITDPVRQKHSQTTLIGSGTCLPLIVMYTRHTKYTYIFGSGAEDPLFYGPFAPELINRLKLLNSRFISVRGNISKTFLRDWGIDSEVIGDPCLSLKPPNGLEKCNNRIAINIGDATADFSWKSGDRVLRELSKVCKVLKAKGYELVLVPFWKENLDDVNSLSKQAGIEIFEKWQDIGATMNLLSTCKILIGEKLHSLVFSAAANTPFIGLAYAPEHFDFVDSVGFSEFTMPTTEITAETILSLFDDITNNYETVQNKLATYVKGYREKQSEFAARIDADLKSLPEDKWSTQNNFENTLMLRADLLLYTKVNKMWNVWDRLVFSHLMPHLI
jgi:polysaccharide pyruvyl transferase WcaK-like protein